MCDAKYCFTYVDFGQHRSTNDSSVLRSFVSYKAFEESNFHISPFGETEKSWPYYLLRDAIFPLKLWLIRPYQESLDDPKKIFNNCLSKVIRTIENAYGFLVERWRISERPTGASIETVQSIIGAFVCPHSYLQATQTSSYSPHDFIDIEGFDGTIKEGFWGNIVRSDRALTSFTKAKEGRVTYDAKSSSSDSSKLSS